MLESPAGEYEPQQQQHRGRAHNEPLYTEKIFSDRKIFFMDLKENDRGRFVKITEDVRGRRDTIMLPVEALGEFLDALNRVADYDDDLEAGVEPGSQSEPDSDSDSESEPESDES
ncbi:MAG: PUR family DNA/RNA-binding protein [Verrucomicrobiales bacterium]